MEDDVAIGLAELDFFVGSRGRRFRHEHQLERLVDMGRDRLAGDDAALLERCAPDGPRRGRSRQSRAKRDMRFEPVDARQAEALCDRAALGLVGDKVEPLAVADLVEPEPMREPVGHSSLPFVERHDARSR